MLTIRELLDIHKELEEELISGDNIVLDEGYIYFEEIERFINNLTIKVSQIKGKKNIKRLTKIANKWKGFLLEINREEGSQEYLSIRDSVSLSTQEDGEDLTDEFSIGNFFKSVSKRAEWMFRSATTDKPRYDSDIF